MFSNKKIDLILILILFLIFPQKVQAAFSYNISSPSATLITSGSQEIDVSLNITDLPSESYFRVSLQKESGGSYYGYIKNNNNEWAKIQTLSGDCSGYFKVSDLKTILINLKYKVGDDLALDNGNYILKAHKFTKTCSSYADSENTIAFVITLPTPTPTQVPTNAPTPTVSPAKTSTPIPTPTSTPKLIPTKTPTQTPTESPTSVQNETEFTTIPTVLQTPSGVVMGVTTTKKSPILAVIFIVLGAGFLGYVGYMIYNQTYAKNQKTP